MLFVNILFIRNIEIYCRNQNVSSSWIVILEYASLSFLDDFVAFLAPFFRSMVLMFNLEQTFSPAHPYSTPLIVVDLPSGLLSNDTNFSVNFISGVILDNKFPWFPPCLSSLYSPLPLATLLFRPPSHSRDPYNSIFG